MRRLPRLRIITTEITGASGSATGRFGAVPGRFASDSVRVHLLRAVAAGTSPDYVIQTRVPPEAEPNMFDSGILEYGRFVDITFPVPGSVLFACQYHPWMQGLITVRPQEGGSPPRDLPETFQEIVPEVRPVRPDDGGPPPVSVTRPMEVVTDRTEYSNGGDPVSVTVIQPPDSAWRAGVSRGCQTSPRQSAAPRSRRQSRNLSWPPMMITARCFRL